MRYIIYSALRNKELAYETLYSLLTVFADKRAAKEIKAVIYTNHKDTFMKEIEKNDYPHLDKVIFEEVADDTLAEWISDGYVYIVKIHVIRDFLYKYKANVLFIDSDMYITGDLFTLFDLIEKSEFVMYTERSSLINQYLIKIKIFDLFRSFAAVDDNLTKLNYKHYLSGSLGINREYGYITDDAIRLCKRLFRYTRAQESEETAFSSIIQNIGKVNTADDVMQDYSTIQIKRIFIGFAFGMYFDSDKSRITRLLDISAWSFQGI